MLVLVYELNKSLIQTINFLFTFITQSYTLYLITMSSSSVSFESTDSSSSSESETEYETLRGRYEKSRKVSIKQEDKPVYQNVYHVDIKDRVHRRTEDIIKRVKQLRHSKKNQKKC